MTTRTCLLLCLLPLASQAGIYQWTDASGQVHFGDKAPGTAKAREVKVKVNSYRHVSYQQLPAGTTPAAGRQVVLYGTRWCGYCKQARAHFQARGIPYTEYDIETNARAKQDYDRLGGEGVPVILVGRARMNGFSAQGFDTLYGR